MLGTKLEGTNSLLAMRHDPMTTLCDDTVEWKILMRAVNVKGKHSRVFSRTNTLCGARNDDDDDDIGYMPRGPNVAVSLCIVSNTKQDLSYFCMWACCPCLKRLARLSGHLAKQCKKYRCER